MKARRTTRSLPRTVLPAATAVLLGVAALGGCGDTSLEAFDGSGTFSITMSGTQGQTRTEQISAPNRLLLRRSRGGGTDLVFDRVCALRSRAGAVMGTYSCKVPVAGSLTALSLQQGSWIVTERLLEIDSSGCDRRLYELTLSARGTGPGGAASLRFSGSREVRVCPQADSYPSGGGTWSWDEGPYSDDTTWDDGGGYDWDDDGDWGDFAKKKPGSERTAQVDHRIRSRLVR